uniref:Uncharacterized protein n=1 Tax=Rhizophora mucronata TaxID=61149 RepID=A0A2P2NM60_RHIMU
MLWVFFFLVYQKGYALDIE